MKKIEFSGKTFTFKYLDDAECWVSKIEIDGTLIDFEIDMEFHNQDEVNWKHFESFLTYIDSPNKLNEFVEYGHNPIKSIGLAFFRKCLDDVKTWEMKFSNSIMFRGHSKGINHRENFEFSLGYEFFVRNENDTTDGDPYGLYLVDINSNEGINGARRIQC